jgi:PhnB protein
MKSINPYFNFLGNTEEAFNFYKSVFGGEFTTIQRYKDMPDSEKLSESDKKKIMHIAFPVGDGIVLMGSDYCEFMGYKFIEGNNISLVIDTESREDADKLFNGLSTGGKITMPISDTFWGAYYGMFVDKFGIQWMISYTKPQV